MFLRQMWRSDPPPFDETGAAGQRLRIAPVVAAILAAGVSLFPMAVFVSEFAQSRERLGKAISWAWYLYIDDAQATFLVAALAALLAAGMGLAAVTERWHSRLQRRAVGAAAAALVVLALLPPVVIAQALIHFWNRRWGVPESWRWHPYDDTPVAWLSGILARFGFIPVLLILSARHAGREDAAEQARVDGAAAPQVLRYVRVRELARPLLAGGLLLGCLTLSEIQASSMLIPARYGTSLAVSVDQEIHFGRQPNLVAMCILLTIPAMICAALLPWLIGRLDGPSGNRQCWSARTTTSP
jgi:ABC-type Fe3+ transport system permease subunit